MGLRKRIGVMIPSTNTSCEADFQMAAPQGVTIHGQRLWLTNDEQDEAAMDRMNSEIESGARYLATANVDVVAYGCTTGSFYKGSDWDRDMIELIERKAGVPALATGLPVRCSSSSTTSMERQAVQEQKSTSASGRQTPEANLATSSGS